MIELNKIYCGDSLEVLKTFPDSSIDLILTSPPYNFGIEYDNYKDFLSWPDYYAWCRTWIAECYRVLKDDGRFVINHYFSGGTAERRSYPLFRLNDIAMDIGLKHHSVLFWNDVTISTKTAWGSWMSASSPYINSPFEGFLVLYKNQWKKANKGIDTIARDDFMKLCYGVITDSPNRNKNHPATFPLKIAKLFVEGLSFMDAVVLDPFMGSGTVAVACKETHRNYIGIDVSSIYVDLANERLMSASQIHSIEDII
jgi:site-specific DNA-methyltransferase (adenine-specific)